MSEPKVIETKINLEIPFHDVDSLNLVWHGHYYKYFELARTELLRAYGQDIPGILELGYGVVVVDSYCRYIQPLRYGQKVTVTAKLVEWEYRIKVTYQIHDAESGRRMARGHTIQATIELASGELCLMTPDVVVDIFRKLKKRELG